MKVSLFDYQLPNHLIAQHPQDKRDHSRLLKVDKQHTLKPVDYMFYDLPELLDPNDVIVLNNTKVIPARLFGVKTKTKAHIELLVLDEVSKDVYRVLTKPAKKIGIGDVVVVGDDLSLSCTGIAEDGIRIYTFTYQGILLERFAQYGSLPLPPYIKSSQEDESRYQTVYAKHYGSSAAPTAGLHFTEDILNTLKDKGIRVIEITLHVGLGTFRPVTVDDTDAHKMHEETYVMSEESVFALNQAKQLNKRIISVGTTSLRALESNYQDGLFHAGTFQTSIFIQPGYEFKAINGLITNFHLPKSTLLMLVSALTERTYMLSVYEHAIRHEYRFFSFGDAMLII